MDIERTSPLPGMLLFLMLACATVASAGDALPSAVKGGEKVGSIGKAELLEPHHDGIAAARFTPDGKRIVSLGQDGTLVEWDFIRQRIVASSKLRELKAGEPGVMSGDGRYLLLSDIDGNVTLHDLKKKVVKTVPCQLLPDNGKKPRSVAALAMSDDAGLLILADSYNTLYRSEQGGAFTPIGNQKESYTPNAEPSAMAIAPDGRMVAVSSAAELRGYDTKTGAEVRYFAHRREGIAHSISFSSDGRYLTAGMPIRFAAGVAIGEFPVWEVKNGELAHSFDLDDGLPFYSGFSRDGRYLFTGASGLCSIVDIQSGRQLVRFRPEQVNLARNAMSESADGRFLLVAGVNGMLKVYDYRQLLAGKSPPPLASLESRRRSVSALAFAPDGKTLAITHDQSATVQLFDLPSRTLARQVKGSNPYHLLHFSADGSRMTGVAGEEIAVWRYPTLAQATGLKRRHTSSILFSADGNRALAMDNQVPAGARHKEKRGRGEWVSEVTEYDLLKVKEVRTTVLENLNTGANVFRLLCVDFDKQIASFRLYPASVYSLKDGSLLREVRMPKVPEGEWLSIWEDKWRFDCDKLDFVPAGPEQTNKPAEHAWDYAASADGRTRARIDGSKDGSVTIYDAAGKELNHFRTIATAWDKGNRSRAVALSPDGGLLAVGVERGDVGLYDAVKGSEIGRYIYFSDGEWAWIGADGKVNGSESGKARLELAEE